MFSGIVEELGTVREVRVAGEPKRLVLGCERAVEDARVGDSIAVNGVCLTVETFDARSFTSGVMPETLRRTNLGALRPGDRVNLERSLPATGRVGGHFVQGHVDGTGEVLELRPDGAALIVKVSLPPRLARYVVEKGYISVDGASLTVVEATPGWFTVSLVHHTREHTTLAAKRPGDPVNLEVDIIAKYVERLVEGGR
jgi:riboflavin synthase